MEFKSQETSTAVDKVHVSSTCWFRLQMISWGKAPLFGVYRIFSFPPPRQQSCLIWNLGSFGKLAIRTILWEYVYVSLVFLQINSEGRGQAEIFHLTAAPLLRLGTWFCNGHSCSQTPSASRNCLLISLPHSHHYKYYCLPPRNKITVSTKYSSDILHHCTLTAGSFECCI